MMNPANPPVEGNPPPSLVRIWAFGLMIAGAALAGLGSTVLAGHEEHEGPVSETQCFDHRNWNYGMNGDGWYGSYTGSVYCCWTDAWGYGWCTEFYCQSEAGSGARSGGEPNGCTQGDTTRAANFDHPDKVQQADACTPGREM